MTVLHREAAVRTATSDEDHDGAAVAADAFLSRVFTDYVESGPPLWRYALRRPALAARTLVAITRLPALAVSLPVSAEADMVAALLLDHPTSRRVMLGVAAVLRTPTTPGRFSLGSDRGTLRRKMRAAARRGVTVRPVPFEDRRDLLALAQRHEQENERKEYRNEAPELEDLLQIELWLAAYDVDDRPIMLAVIPRAGRWSVLRYFRTLVADHASSDARYLMTDALAETLGTLGVRYLVDSSRPHWLPNGLRHFQRMVGFRLVRIRGVRRAARRRGPVEAPPVEQPSGVLVPSGRA